MDNIFIEHIKDLSNASEKKCKAVFTSFLNLDEQSTVISLKNELCHFEMFGGSVENERKIACFMPSYTNCEETAYPIACIKICPKNARFSDTLTHRDYLGAVMNLGIVRSQTGDIFTDGTTAFMFVVQNKADYIISELKKVNHTDVVCSIVQNIPVDTIIKTEEVRITAASNRLDCIIGSVYNLSRSTTLKLIDAKKTFVNSKEQTKASFELKNGDIVSVRGFGKFLYSDEVGTTKKGRLCVTVKKYI